MIAANQKDSLIARSRSLRWQEIDRKQRIAKRDARHVSANAVVIQTLQTVRGLLHNPFVLSWWRQPWRALENGIKNTVEGVARDSEQGKFLLARLTHNFASRLRKEICRSSANSKTLQLQHDGAIFPLGS